MDPLEFSIWDRVDLCILSSIYTTQELFVLGQELCLLLWWLPPPLNTSLSVR